MITTTIASQAYAHYKNCSSKYDIGHIWNDKSGNLLFMRNIIEDANLRENAVNLVQKADLFNIYSPDEAITILRRNWNLAHGGLYEDLNSSKTVLYLNRIKTVLGNVSSILEIGVGLGNVGVYSKVPYIGVDIPETLFFAYINCLEKCPNRKVVWLENEKDLEDYDILFIPIGKEHLLTGKKFDLAMNTCSFGELNSNTQKFWINFLEKVVDINYFYSLNRFLNIIDDDHFGALRKLENSFNLSFNNIWAVRSWEVEPWYAQCPYEDTRAARCLEIIFDCKELDDTCLDPNIFLEDFTKVQTRYILGTLAARSLRSDLTSNGSLFALWNAYRLTNDADILATFKKYLRYIGDSRYLFEEEYYEANAL